MSKQSPSAVQAMSCLEDIDGRVRDDENFRIQEGERDRFPKRREGLRRKQLEFCKALIHHDGRKIVGQFTTGYGKSWIILISYALLRILKGSTRLLIIVPYTEQLTQYKKGIYKDAQTLGIDITDVKKCNRGSGTTLMYHRRNEADIFITTIHHFSGNISFYEQLFSAGQWVIAGDELHHYSTDNTWGKAFESVFNIPNIDKFIGVTATPYRTNKREELWFGTPDMYTTNKEALSEGAIRPIRDRGAEYVVDISFRDEEIHRINTNELEEHISRLRKDYDLTKSQVIKELRFHRKYISAMLGHAITELTTRQLSDAGQHQMMIFATNVSHAKHIVEIINKDFKNVAIVSEWVGTGPDGRADNEAIVQAFKDGFIDILVNVNVTGEGFDHDKCSILVFMNMLSSDTFTLAQHVGRGLRRNYCIDFTKDECSVFYSTDSEVGNIIKTFLEEQQEAIELPPEDDPEDRESSDPKVFSIPEWFIVDANMTGIKNDLIHVLQGDLKAEGRDLTEGDIMLLLSKLKERGLVPKDIVPALMPLDDRLEIARTKVSKACTSYIGNVIRVKFGKSYDRSLFGDMIRQLHFRASKAFGGYTEVLNEHKLKEKYNWVKELNRLLKVEKHIPEWLNLIG